MANLERNLVQTVVGVRSFVPARDFELSKRFYSDLGFSINHADADVAEVSIGKFSFILQNKYDPRWAEFTALHLYVKDLGAWWKHIDGLKLREKYGVKSSIAPAMQKWGLSVSFVYDPSNVLWHVCECNAACLTLMRMAGELELTPAGCCE